MELRGAERIDPSKVYLFASNHSSPFDPPLAHAALPVPAAFVCNAALAEIPVFSTWLRHSGSVLVAQGKGDGEIVAFKHMIAALKGGTNLLLFPEGYIHQGSGLAEFKRGGIYSAVISGASIVPMCVSGSQEVMRAGDLRVSPRRRVLVEISEPIDTTRISHAERKNIESVVRERMLEMKRSQDEELARSPHAPVGA
jgi:1-acyl-sn-glycerol-3-phosphate acyltransferase